VGRNLEVALERLGHLAGLLVESVDDLAAEADLVVLGHDDPAFADFCHRLPARTRVLDLVGCLRDAPRS
jgi:GDP-mannose 6-dehydrogenase